MPQETKMQQFPHQDAKNAKIGYWTSPANNHKFVRLNLSIGDCKLLDRLLNEQITKVEAGLFTDENNALEQLANSVYEHIRPNDAERAAQDDEFNDWLDSQDPDGVNALLQAVAMNGVENAS